MNRTRFRSLLATLFLSATSLGGCAGELDVSQSPGGSESQQPASPALGESTGPDAGPSPAPAVEAPQAALDPEPGSELLESGFDIDPEKSLLIRDPAIVDNATRTIDPCDARRRGIARGPVTAAQTWTFGHLMTQMANGRDPAVFAQNWLANWAISARVNGDDLVALPSRTNSITTLPGRIYDAWQRESGGSAGGTIQLAMNRAPFRLLAIVNRFDLRKNRRFNEGNSGELRFIFSVLDLDRLESNGQGCLQARSIDTVSTGNPGDQLLILEYAVDHLSDTARRDWISKWTALYGLAFTDAAFAIALEQLTQTVVRAGAGGSRPNGSALIRLRTNESTDAVHWDLREFAINGSGYLVPAAVKQTPKTNFTPQMVDPGLVNWIANNGSSILADTHRVPDGYLGSHSINQASNTTWVFALQNFGVPSNVAYEFSRRTCVGCHSMDTGASFFHVHGRPFKVRPEISHFLDGAYPGSPPSCPQDPDGNSHCFNELADRAADILSYLNGGG